MTSPTATLLDQARTLNASLEKSYLALAVALTEIEEKELWKGEYESFVDFYENDLHRERSTVSRLLKVGQWLKKNRVAVPAGNISYKRLAQSITQFPDKDPKYILSVAQTWKDDDFRAEKKETCTNHEWIEVCKHCWAKRG